jgi:hypothetical protein
MTDGLLVAPPVQAAIQNGRVNLVEGGQKKLHGADAVRRRFRRDAVEFAAIAGGKHQRLREDAARAQLVGRSLRLVGSE